MSGWIVFSRIGARLGNWNDRHSKHDRRAEAPFRYRVLDRIAGRLYVLGDRATQEGESDK